MTLELKLHIGFQGRLTNPTLNTSTDPAIQLKIAIMKTIVNIIGFIIEDCICICSGIISICIFCILSALAVSLAILASLSCLPTWRLLWEKWACCRGSMKKERIIVFTIMIEEPTMNTVGTKKSWWNGNNGSMTVPAPSERATRISGFTISSTIMPRRKSIGTIMDDMASA